MYLRVLLCFVLTISVCGCKKSGSEADPEFSVDPPVLSFGKNSQENSIEIYNVGGDVLVWFMFDKPDWIVLEYNNGEVLEDESMPIKVYSDLSRIEDFDSLFTDSVRFRSDGGAGTIYVDATVDIIVPENGTYSGTTAEGLDIIFDVKYNRIIDFHGDYWDQSRIRQESLPEFGLIVYEENEDEEDRLAVFSCTTTTEDNDYTLIGSYNSSQTRISGEWNINGGILAYDVYLVTDGGEDTL